MLAVAEELCIEQIYYKQKDHGKITLNFEYDKAKEEIQYRVSFGGKAWNPLEDDTSVAVMLLKHAASENRYYTDESGNHVEGWIRG